MTGKAFLNAVANGEADILQLLLEIMADIARLVEASPALAGLLPAEVRDKLA